MGKEGEGSSDMETMEPHALAHFLVGGILGRTLSFLVHANTLHIDCRKLWLFVE